jgi:mRNA-degrading endonuclease RelE of RelBE toxin-antitoxin system
MYRVFRSDWYDKKLNKLDNQEQKRVSDFEQELKIQPYSGRPLGYEFLREKKFDGKRLLFLIYDKHNIVFLITITDKKAQQQEIDFIKTHLDIYQNQVEELMKRL